MSEARKCDRCSSYFEHDGHTNNYIVFGRKHIIVDLKKGKEFDICPNCMKEFEDWIFSQETIDPAEKEHPTEDENTLYATQEEVPNKKLCHFDYCKNCLSFIHKPAIPGETGYSEVRCGRYHTSIPMRGADPRLIDSITPDMFMKEEKG